MPQRDDPGETSRDDSMTRAHDSLRIGELAAATGVTTETIRYYEREGVLPPAPRGGAGRYRRYSAADAERLRFIRRARELGFSIEDVRELLALAGGGGPCADVRRLALRHLTQVDEKVARLTALRAELARAVARCGDGTSAEGCGILAALGGA
jgi:DNA-binding transcriptional MerR regulator